MLDLFLEELKEAYLKIGIDDNYLIEFKRKWTEKESIGEVYQNLCLKEFKRDKGSFYTPYEIINYMIRDVLTFEEYKKNPYMRILDPACGGGWFLTEIFDILKGYAKRLGIENPMEHVVNKNIFGFDIDENAVKISTIELYNKSGILSSNIKSADFLFEGTNDFDIIIGNPPYIGHKLVESDYRKRLSSVYSSVFSDKGDISYCFIKKSLDSLKIGGVLEIFTSRYLLEALNGRDIREYIKNNAHIKKIIDFYGIRVVKGAGIDNIIMTLIKGENNFIVEYVRLNDRAKGMGEDFFSKIDEIGVDFINRVITTKDELDKEGWIFLSGSERRIFEKIRGIELGAICESSQGIITGCDDAFVLKKNEKMDLKIEEELLKPWIKGKNIREGDTLEAEEYIIYSDLIDNEKNYKNAISYIEKYKDRLNKRRECIKGLRKWYQLQWGRNKEIFEEEKIIFPYKSSKNRFSIDKGNYFSADIYTLKIKDLFLSSYTYDFLTGVLNSRIYEFYIKSMAKKLGEDLYEYYPNKILKLKIPNFIKEIHDASAAKLPDMRDRIDKALMEHFNINEKEYEEIKKWCRE